ncbi:MAG: Crp/Fnr family transcriptional regulator [Caldilineaceae bacterium]
MPGAQKQMLNLLSQISFLHDIPQQVLQDLSTVASQHQYDSGAIIFFEGDPTAGLYVIERGKVKISRFTVEGREHILHIYDRGHTFNDVSTLDGGTNPATAIAFTDATVWRIMREDIRQVAQRHPDLAWALIEGIAVRTRNLVNLIESLSMRTVKGRLAKLLLEQAKSNQINEIPRFMTYEEMASHLGTVREMIGRALNSLTAAEIIQVERHQIIILDMERLASEAEVK